MKYKTISKESFDPAVLKGKIFQVKAGDKGLCVVRVNSCTKKDKLIRVSFTYLVVNTGNAVPGEQEIMMVPEDKVFVNGDLVYWETWGDYFEDAE